MHNLVGKQKIQNEMILLRAIAGLMAIISMWLPYNYISSHWFKKDPRLTIIYGVMWASALAILSLAWRFHHLAATGKSHWYHSSSLIGLMFAINSWALMMNPDRMVIFYGGYSWFYVLLIVMAFANQNKRVVMAIGVVTGVLHATTAYLSLPPKGVLVRTPSTSVVVFVGIVYAAMGVFLYWFKRLKTEDEIYRELYRSHEGLCLTNGEHGFRPYTISVRQGLEKTITTGDFVLAMQNGGRDVLMLFGDVTGNGISVSAHVGYISAVFHMHSGKWEPISVLNHMNSAISRFPNEISFTAVCLLLRKDGSALYSGYQQSIQIRRSDGEREVLKTDGPIFGIWKRFALNQYQFYLDPGDSFVLHSDGIIDGPDTNEDQTISKVSYAG